MKKETEEETNKNLSIGEEEDEEEENEKGAFDILLFFLILERDASIDLDNYIVSTPKESKSTDGMDDENNHKPRNYSRNPKFGPQTSKTDEGVKESKDLQSKAIFGQMKSTMLTSNDIYSNPTNGHNSESHKQRTFSKKSNIIKISSPLGSNVLQTNNFGKFVSLSETKSSAAGEVDARMQKTLNFFYEKKEKISIIQAKVIRLMRMIAQKEPHSLEMWNVYTQELPSSFQMLLAGIYKSSEEAMPPIYEVTGF